MLGKAYVCALACSAAFLPWGGLTAAPAAGLEAREMRKLQGAWEIVRFQFANTVQKTEGRNKVVIKGDTLSWGKMSGRFTIDPTRRPKHLTLTYSEGGKERRWYFIYSFDDEQLLLGFSFWHDKAPPPEFNDTLLRLKPAGR